MASESVHEILSSSIDESDYEPQPKRKKSSTPSAEPSCSAARDVENIAPNNPEMIRHEKKLKAFAKDIQKAFPWTKFGSSRDAFCYRRVRGHVNVFKRESLEQCKNFVDLKQWKQVLDYVVIAWRYVDQLPRWDDPKHNKMNEQCYKKLSSFLTSALKKGTFQKQELQQYINAFKTLVEETNSESHKVEDNGMLNSIKLAETILKKIK